MLWILEDFVSKTDITTIDKSIVWTDGPSVPEKYCLKCLK